MRPPRRQPRGRRETKGGSVVTADTRTSLLQAAERAARRRGYDGFSFAHLAADVGIRKASIHHHFPTKPALALALVKNYRAEMTVALDAISERHATAAEQLRALVAHYRAALMDGEGLCLCVALSVSREALRDDVAEEIACFRADVIRWLSGVFAHDGHAEGRALTAARAALALLEGAQLAARCARNPRPFDDATAQFARQAARLTG